MEYFEQDIRNHNTEIRNRIIQQFGGLQKGDGPAQEGEIREWANGTKMQKRGDKWVPVSENKSKRTKEDPTPKKTKQLQPKNKKQPQKEEIKKQPSKQDIAQLTSIKQLLKDNPEKAHEIANSLPDHVKELIPQGAWHLMTEASLKKEDEDSKEITLDLSSPESIAEALKNEDTYGKALDAFSKLSKEDRWDVEDLTDEELYDKVFEDAVKIKNQRVKSKKTSSASSINPEYKDSKEVLKELESWANEFELSKEESEEGIEEYQSTSFKYINDHLRGKQESKKDHVHKSIKILDNIFKTNKNAVIKEDTVVYRGMPNGSMFDGLEEGDSFQDKAFQSTSPDIKVAIDKFGGFRGMVVKINLKKGTKAIPASQITKYREIEHEVILDRNAKYTINKIDKENKIVELTLG